MVDRVSARRWARAVVILIVSSVISAAQVGASLEPASGASKRGAAAPAPTAAYVSCPAGTPSRARCGTVSVPLDRAHPAGARIAIAFQLYPASNTATPAVSTIVPSIGGPGLSNIASAGVWLSRIQPLLARHNFLAIDHRGTGASQAIDCPGLQHVQGNQQAAARACGRQLGAAAYRYGSGDVAEDIEAVRQALHLGKIDYYGASYGAVDVRAYAYRYPQNLRSAILDSPYNSKDAAFIRTLPTAMARISALVCRRSPSCSAANRHPEKTFSDLVRRLRKHPVTGIGYDANGAPHRLKVDERALLGILYNDYFSDPAFLNQGEIIAAATALRRGDTVPLLRLLAESPTPTDFGPANGFSSVGADYAVFCADSRFPWDKNASERVREAQYRHALNILPRNATAPFTPSAWADVIASQPTLLIPGADACVPWPKPIRPNPPFPDGQTFPAGVPALLFGGELDYLDINSERSLIPLFKSGRFVTVADAGHATTLWNACAQSIAVRFLQTLRAGDTRCAADRKGAMGNPFGAATGKVQLQGVARFPRVAGQAVPAGNDPARALRTPLFDRRVAAVAWLTVVDAVYRLPRMTGTAGRGLRGGSYAVTRSGGTTRIDYHRARFSKDVYVSGRITLDAGNRLSGLVTVAGPCGRSGTLVISARLWDPSHPLASLRGTLHGKDIAVLTQTR
jgi:pimeloyl-ACP methyl ester carboxylesterase